VRRVQPGARDEAAFGFDMIGFGRSVIEP
jgi:hypothetical protein